MNLKLLFILFHLFSIVSCNVRRIRMINGSPTKIEKYPYIAYGGHCTASIIHERYILSALHCYSSPDGLSFWVGVDDRNNIPAGVQHFAEAVFRKAPDTALIRLAQPITFNSRAQPIKLNSSLAFTKGEIVTVAGFGITESGGYSQELREGNFTFGEYLNPDFVSVYSLNNGLATGDSGSPAVVYREDPLHCGPPQLFQIGTATSAGRTTLNGTWIYRANFAAITPSICAWLKESSNNEIEC